MMFVKTLTLTLILISSIVNHVAVSSAFVSNTYTLTYNVSTKTRRRRRSSSSRMKQNTNNNNYYYYNNNSNNILFSSSKSTPPPPSTTSTNNNNGNEKNKNNEHNNNNHLDSSTFIHCDDSNIPPSLQKIISSIHSIKSGSDIRGTFVDHSRVGSVLNVSTTISTTTSSTLRAITPFAAYCYGAAFAKMVQIRSGKGSAVLSSLSSSLDTAMTTTTTTTTTTATTTPMAKFIIHTANNLFPTSDVIISSSSSSSPASSASPLLELETTNICIGRDPRQSGIRLADAFCRGVESIQGVKVYYTDLASTPSMFAFCRSHSLDCDGGVMVSMIIIIIIIYIYIL